MTMFRMLKGSNGRYCAKSQMGSFHFLSPVSDTRSRLTPLFEIIMVVITFFVKECIIKKKEKILNNV